METEYEEWLRLGCEIAKEIIETKTTDENKNDSRK